MAEAFAGRMSVGRVFRLVERLSFEPRSVFRARVMGGEEHWAEWIGWDRNSELLARVIAKIQFHIDIVTAAPKVRVSEPAPERPGMVEREPTVATPEQIANLATLINMT